MAINNIRLGGINSGFDTEAMIKKMMSSYQTKIDNQSKKLTKLSWQQEAYQDITTKLTDFKNKYFDILKRDTYLKSPSTFKKFNSKVSASGDTKTDGLKVTTTSNSLEGKYTFNVSQLATATKAAGKSIVPANFSLDLDKAIESVPGELKKNSDNTYTKSFEFSLDVQVGSATKTVKFSADVASDANGTVDKSALKQKMVESLNTSLQESFGYSGRPAGDPNAAGALDADGKEWFLQAEMGANGKVAFKVGGNSSVTVTENRGNFGLTEMSSSHYISPGSAVNGTNTFSIEIGGETKVLSFEGASSAYFDSRDKAGNGAIKAEYESLKAAAYRKEKGLAANAYVSKTELDNYTYTSAQAAIDKNAIGIEKAANEAFGGKYNFSITGKSGNLSLVATNKNGAFTEFRINALDGGTLGLAKASAGNKFSSDIKLSAMGLTSNADFGGYSIEINGKKITVSKDASMSGLIDAVNKSGAGVTMSYSSLINSFSVTSNELGGAGEVKIGDNAITRALGLVDESGKTIGYTQGQNAIFKINGEDVYLNDNSYTMDGTTFKFENDMELGKDFTVEISKSYDDVKDLIKGFVEDYNKLIEDVYDYIGKTPARDKKNNTYDPLTDEQKEEMTEKEIEKWEAKAKEGILFNDPTVTNIMSQMRMALYNGITLEDGTKFGLYNMGITTTNNYKEHGKLTIDEDKLNAAFEKNADAITKLFTDTENGVMAKIDKTLENAVKSSGAASSRGSLIRKAGKANSSVTTDSTIYKEMQKVQNRISDLQTRYNKKEDYWWNVFTRMETMMSKLNSQTDYISQYLGTLNNNNSQ